MPNHLNLRTHLLCTILGIGLTLIPALPVSAKSQNPNDCSNRSGLQILRETWVDLPPATQYESYFAVIDAMARLESQTRPHSSAQTHWLDLLGLSEAIADPSTACIVAGYVGIIGTNGRCGLGMGRQPTPLKDAFGNVTCNPDVFGKGVSLNQDEQKNPLWTSTCAEKFKTKYQEFCSKKNPEGIPCTGAERFTEFLNAENINSGKFIDGVLGLCDTAVSANHKLSGIRRNDQKVCEDLSEQILGILPNDYLSSETKNQLAQKLEVLDKIKTLGSNCNNTAEKVKKFAQKATCHIGTLDEDTPRAPYLAITGIARGGKPLRRVFKFANYADRDQALNACDNASPDFDSKEIAVGRFFGLCRIGTGEPNKKTAGELPYINFYFYENGTPAMKTFHFTNYAERNKAQETCSLPNAAVNPIDQAKTRLEKLAKSAGYCTFTTENQQPLIKIHLYSEKGDQKNPIKFAFPNYSSRDAAFKKCGSSLSTFLKDWNDRESPF